jgi:hypothetical protein
MPARALAQVIDGRQRRRVDVREACRKRAAIEQGYAAWPR